MKKQKITDLIKELFDEVSEQQKGGFECGYRMALVDINEKLDLKLNLNWDFLTEND